MSELWVFYCEHYGKNWACYGNTGLYLWYTLDILYYCQNKSDFDLTRNNCTSPLWVSYGVCTVGILNHIYISWLDSHCSWHMCQINHVVCNRDQILIWQEIPHTFPSQVSYVVSIVNSSYLPCMYQLVCVVGNWFVGVVSQRPDIYLKHPIFSCPGIQAMGCPLSVFWKNWLFLLRILDKLYFLYQDQILIWQ